MKTENRFPSIETSTLCLGGAMKNFLYVMLIVAAAVVGETAHAQPPKNIPRIGYLTPGFPPSPPSTLPSSPTIEAFRQGLRELGYIEGKNIIIEYRYAEQKFERFPELAAELVRLKVDMIRPGGGPASLKAAVNATKTIPIIMVTSFGDPVKDGLIDSLARPGGNITGLIQTSELMGKRLELVKEVVPRLSRVSVLWDANIGPYVSRKDAEDAARALKVQLIPVEVRSRADLEGAFKAVVKQRSNALHVAGTPLTSKRNAGTRIAELAIKNRLPTISQWSDFAEAGGLMTYGPDLLDMNRRAATYVDKILKGAKAADLPVQQPMKFEFVINLKTAKEIGLTIPQWTLMRADKVLK
jgi:putative ABC transport system substrate-binding protein